MLFRHVVIWLGALLAELIVVSFFSSPVATYHRIVAEAKAAYILVGERPTQQALESTDALFAACCKAGVQASDPLFVDAKEAQNSLIAPVKAYVGMTNNVVLAFWAIIYQALFRWLLFWRWILPSAILLVAATVDGLAVWRRKQHVYGYSSPAVFNLASHLLILLIFGSLGYLIAPIYMSPLYLPYVCIALVVPVMWLFGNQPKTPE